MKDMKKFVLGGLAVLGAASAAYRAFELRKMKKRWKSRSLKLRQRKSRRFRRRETNMLLYERSDRL